MNQIHVVIFLKVERFVYAIDIRFNFFFNQLKSYNWNIEMVVLECRSFSEMNIEFSNSLVIKLKHFTILGLPSYYKRREIGIKFFSMVLLIAAVFLVERTFIQCTDFKILETLNFFTVQLHIQKKDYVDYNVLRCTYLFF